MVSCRGRGRRTRRGCRGTSPTGAFRHCCRTGRFRSPNMSEPPRNQIENPNPRPDTNNWYSQSSYSGGSYTRCADPAGPGARAIRSYLGTLPYRAFKDGNCEPGAFYLVNNYSAGFTALGEPA